MDLDEEPEGALCLRGHAAVASTSGRREPRAECGPYEQSPASWIRKSMRIVSFTSLNSRERVK